MNQERTEPIASGELARLRRIEEAAAQVLRQWDGKKRSATAMLSAIAALRAALKGPGP